MAQNIFTQDFYKKVYDALYEYCEKNYESDGEHYGTMIASINVDGYDIECEASIECEIHDESFDHAFGTWHDPFAGYYFSDVDGISDVTVWDENGTVEGFSIEDYEAQFKEDGYKNIKKGDRVLIRDRYGRYSEPYEVEYYNNRTCEFRVRVERQFRDGKKYYQTKDVSHWYVKKAA